MNWIKLKSKQPPIGVSVNVKFGNGSIIKGKWDGRFMSFDPKDTTFEIMKSDMKEWSLDDDADIADDNGLECSSCAPLS